MGNAGKVILLGILIALLSFLASSGGVKSGNFALNPDADIESSLSPTLAYANSIAVPNKVIPIQNKDVASGMKELYSHTRIVYSQQDLDTIDASTQNLDVESLRAISTIIQLSNDAFFYKTQESTAQLINYIRKANVIAPGMESSCGQGKFIFADPHCVLIIAGKDSNIHTAGTILIDLGGDDAYNCETNCQASAVNGVGILIDLNGNDNYQCQSKCQGYSENGIATFVDFAGSDTYNCNDYCQGFATSLGNTFVISFGGDDEYNCAASCQGSSVSGYAALVDYSGKDEYNCGAACQGSSISGSAVILDSEGDDTYTCTQFCQGFGIRKTGILIDYNGNDRYECFDSICQGLGYLAGTGGLWDYNGDDSFTCKGKCLGSGIAGSGSVIDFAGTDTFNCAEKCRGYAYVNLEEETKAAVGIWKDVGVTGLI